MTLLVQTYMWHQTTSIKALLDSGATHNFIDKRAVEKLTLRTKVLPQKLQVNNVDGTLNQEGDITQYCNLWISRGSEAVKMGFYIANLGKDQLILGHPWFKIFNPTIDWTTNQLLGPDVTIQMAGY